jgi:hypothetical protein
MKRVKIKVPVNMDESTAQFLFENEIRMLMSYNTDGFFESSLVVICGVPDEKWNVFEAKFKSYIK